MDGHPSRYLPRPTMLNFDERRGTSVFLEDGCATKEMLGDDHNLQTVKIYRQLKMSSFMRSLPLINFDYWSELRDSGSVEECRNYLTKHVSDFDTFRDRVNGWIARAEHRLLVSAFDVDSEVKPEGLVSRVDSQVRSGSSRNSSR